MGTVTVAPTRERVEAYEKALGCDQPPAGALIAGAYGLCYHHDETRDALGCPVAVAAARVEAEETGALRAVVEQVRELSDLWSVSTAAQMYVTHAGYALRDILPEATS